MGRANYGCYIEKTSFLTVFWPRTAENLSVGSKILICCSSIPYTSTMHARTCANAPNSCKSTLRFYFLMFFGPWSRDRSVLAVHLTDNSAIGLSSLSLTMTLFKSCDRPILAVRLSDNSSIG